MKRIIFTLILSTLITTGYGQDWLRILSGTLKVGKALTLSDNELANVVSQSTSSMDQSNKVCSESSNYTKRLRRITQGMEDADGIALNFEVYLTDQLNAFACPDGSVRIFSALMDLLSDDELLGVIGHEIGHVALRHTKKAWKEELLRSAASDAAVELKQIEARQQSPDHPILWNVPETDYLKFYIFQVMNQP